MPDRLSRRGLLVGVSLAGAGALGVGGCARLVHGDRGPDGVVPSAAVGDERVEVVHSAARGRDVTFYTAVPAGHGDGRGLPVCLVLHGASATAANFPGFGFGRFLTDSVQRGNQPFVLVGATGDRLFWQPHGSDDPQRMVLEDVPRWCAARGFDTGRMVAWGWSMGGFGSLLLAQARPGFVRAVAAFSPAVSSGDAVFAGVDALRGTRIGLWCGTGDGLYDDVRDLERRLPEPAAVAAYDKGAHTRGYWNRITPAGFDFLAGALT